MRRGLLLAPARHDRCHGWRLCRRRCNARIRLPIGVKFNLEAVQGSIGALTRFITYWLPDSTKASKRSVTVCGPSLVRPHSNCLTMQGLVTTADMQRCWRRLNLCRKTDHSGGSAAVAGVGI